MGRHSASGGARDRGGYQGGGRGGDHRPHSRRSHRAKMESRGPIRDVTQALGRTVPKRVRPPRFHRVLLVSGLFVGLLMFAYSSSQIYLRFSDPQDDGLEGESALEELPPEDSADGPSVEVSPENTASDGSGTSAEVAFETTDRGGGEFAGEITISNTGSEPLDNWDLELTFEGEVQVAAVWQAEWEARPSGARITQPGGEQGIAPGESKTIIFDATGQPHTPSCLLNGQSCGL